MAIAANIPIIGISKESRTTFFREFLIKENLKELIPDNRSRTMLISLALENKRKALERAEKMNDERIFKLITELINRKPDSLLILGRAKAATCASAQLWGY